MQLTELLYRMLDFSGWNPNSVVNHTRPDNHGQNNAYFMRGTNRLATPLVVSVMRRKRVPCAKVWAPPSFRLDEDRKCYSKTEMSNESKLDVSHLFAGNFTNQWFPMINQLHSVCPVPKFGH